MNDREFSQKCAKWNYEVKRLLKKGKFKEAKQLRQGILKHIEEWRAQERLARSKVRILASLYSILEKEARNVEGGNK